MSITHVKMQNNQERLSQYNESAAHELLRRTTDLALGFLSNVWQRPVGVRPDRAAAGAAGGVAILNDVILNQVLVRFTPAAGGDGDALTREVIRRVQADGTCWLGGTTWNGVAAMRVSVSNWSTTEADIERLAAAILRCAHTARGQGTAASVPERTAS